MNQPRKLRPQGDTLRQMLESLEDRPDTLGLKSLDSAALEIGIKLKRARLNLGLTQSELARRSGVDQPVISSIEQGKGPDGPSYRTLNSLATALGMDLAFEEREHDDKAAAWKTVVRASRKSKTLDLVDTERRFFTLTRLLKSMLTQQDQDMLYKKLITHMRSQKTLPKKMEGLRFATYWSLKSKGTSKFDVDLPMLILSYHGTARVRTPSGTASPLVDDIYCIPVGAGSFEIENMGQDNVALVTVPISENLLEAILR